MSYKYQEDYNKLSVDCPPTIYQRLDIEHVYRWVFDDIMNERNFEPQYFQNPIRFNTKSDFEKCAYMSLSMFDNLSGARKRFEELNEFMGTKAFQTLGTKIAQGKIIKQDGVNGARDKYGHFNHHQSLHSDYSKVFTIVESL
jgi:hypothetical protein